MLKPATLQALAVFYGAGHRAVRLDMTPAVTRLLISGYIHPSALTPSIDVAYVLTDEGRALVAEYDAQLKPLATAAVRRRKRPSKIDIYATRICPRCGIEQPSENFKRPNGKAQCYCMPCLKIRTSEADKRRRATKTETKALTGKVYIV